MKQTNEEIIKQIHILETNHGKINLQALNNIKCWILHETLTHQSLNYTTNKEINLQNLQYHRNYPLSMQNTTITPPLIQHQIQKIQQNHNISHSQILLFDYSNYSHKIPDIFKQYNICKPYKYVTIDSNNKQQLLIFKSKQHILKQIQYQFKYGHNLLKPSLIGQLLLDDYIDCNYQFYDDKFNQIQAYFQFCKNSCCPIVLNCWSKGRISHPIIYHLSATQIQQLKSIYSKLETFIKLTKQFLIQEYIIIYNIPFASYYSQKTVQFNIVDKFHELRKQFKGYFAYDLLRYNQISALAQIARQINQYSQLTIISAGIRYKTDLVTYGGDGLQFYRNDYNSQSTMGRLSQLVNNKDKLHACLQTNIKKLIIWQIYKQKIKKKVYWKCQYCLKQSEKQVDAFRKFGKQFCSIGCLKSYKYWQLNKKDQ